MGAPGGFGLGVLFRRRVALMRLSRPYPDGAASRYQLQRAAMGAWSRGRSARPYEVRHIDRRWRRGTDREDIVSGANRARCAR